MFSSPRALLAAICGAAIAAAGASANLWPTNSGLSIISLPIISWASYEFLQGWRAYGGQGKSGIIAHYLLIVGASFAVFAWLLSPQHRPNVQMAVVSLAILVPAIMDYAADFSPLFGAESKPAES